MTLFSPKKKGLDREQVFECMSNAYKEYYKLLVENERLKRCIKNLKAQNKKKTIIVAIN